MPDYKILKIHLKMLSSVHSTSIYIALKINPVPILAMEKNVFKENGFLNITSEAEREAKGARTSHPRTGLNMPLCGWANRSRCKNFLSQPSLHIQGRVSVTMSLNRATRLMKQLLLGWEKTVSLAASGHPGMLPSAVFSTLLMGAVVGSLRENHWHRSNPGFWERSCWVRHTLLISQGNCEKVPWTRRYW